MISDETKIGIDKMIGSSYLQEKYIKIQGGWECYGRAIHYEGRDYVRRDTPWNLISTVTYR